MGKVLKITIGDEVILEKYSSDAYIKAFNFLYAKGLITEEISNDFPSYVRNKKSDWTGEHLNDVFLIEKSTNLYPSTHSSSASKKNQLQKIFEKYEIVGEIEIVTHKNSNKEDYLRWSNIELSVASSTKKQYVKSIVKLSELIGYNVFEVTNANEVRQLYNDLIKEQTKKDGKYYDPKAPSYSLKGFYSAAIQTYLDFLMSKSSPKNSSSDNRISKNYVKNKLAQAICIIGASGVGKSYRINKTLENENHKTLFVIVDNMWQHILFDYSPNDRTYRLTKVGEFIKTASEDDSNFYTIVIDECHKNLEIINDSLLQAISIKRNDGVRFLSLNSIVDEKFNFLPEFKGNRILPDNLGFLFISSKSNIIEGNDDLNNRIEIIELDLNDQDDKNYSIDFLLSKVKEEEESDYSN